MSVAVGLDAAFDPGQLPVGQHLSPPAQVETPLFLVDRQFERQHRHATTLFAPPAQSICGSAGEGPVSLGVALQDHHALGLDRGAIEHGQPRAFGVAAPTARKRPARGTHGPTSVGRLGDDSAQPPSNGGLMTVSRGSPG
jgi:hypothetical protein